MLNIYNWYNRTDKILINAHSNEDTGDYIHHIFGEYCLANNIPLHIGYITINGVKIKNDAVLNILQTIDAKLLISKRSDKGRYNSTYIWSEGVIVLQSQVDDPDGESNKKILSFTINTSNEQTLERLLKEIKVLDNPETTNNGQIYVLTAPGGGLGIQSIGVAATSLEVGNYNDHVIEDNKYIVENLQKKVPNGRIVLLDGPAGTGKSFYLRALLNSVPKATFLLIPSNMVDSLDDPTFMEFFLRYKRQLLSPTILVIEDADRCLAPRAADNISVISTLLNMSDGIIGHLLDIRIVATTNCPLDEIDPAIMRPGRLLKRTHVGVLSNDKANEIYKRLTGKDLNHTGNSLTLAEIYHKANNTENISINTITPRKVGFGA